MTSRLSLNKTDSYVLHIGGTSHLLAPEELRCLKDRIESLLDNWPVGKSFIADRELEPPRDLWLVDRSGDFAGWVSKSDSFNGAEGWGWVQWSDGSSVFNIRTHPWSEFALGFEFTVVEPK